MINAPASGRGRLDDEAERPDKQMGNQRATISKEKQGEHWSREDELDRPLQSANAADGMRRLPAVFALFGGVHQMAGQT